MAAGSAGFEDALGVAGAGAAFVEDFDPELVLGPVQRGEVDVEVGGQPEGDGDGLIVEAYRNTPAVGEGLVGGDGDGLLPGPLSGELGGDFELAGGEVEDRTGPVAVTPVEAAGGDGGPRTRWVRV